MQKVQDLKSRGKVSTMIPAQVEAIKKKDLELILDISFNVMGFLRKMNLIIFLNSKQSLYPIRVVTHG